jgi:hypothetical protein
MPILQWRCAHGEAPAVTLASDRIVELAPIDESVDTNVVHITASGSGIIESFGNGPPVLKRVMFNSGILLVHSPQLQLLCCRDREIMTPSIGLYASDGYGHWNEVHFTATGPLEITRRLERIEQRLAEIERSLKR